MESVKNIFVVKHISFMHNVSVKCPIWFWILEINKFVNLLHSKGISSFLVTNAQVRRVQLYLCVFLRFFCLNIFIIEGLCVCVFFLICSCVLVRHTYVFLIAGYICFLFLSVVQCLWLGRGVCLRELCDLFVYVLLDFCGACVSVCKCFRTQCLYILECTRGLCVCVWVW